MAYDHSDKIGNQGGGRGYGLQVTGYRDVFTDQFLFSIGR